jgi:hypothetical protein
MADNHISNTKLMQVVEVITLQDKKEFINFPKVLYRGDPNWICQLDSSQEAVFDTGKNHSFKNGEAVRWLLKDDNNITIGRIAAFIDNGRSEANSQPT